MHERDREGVRGSEIECARGRRVCVCVCVCETEGDRLGKRRDRPHVGMLGLHIYLVTIGMSAGGKRKLPISRLITGQV